MQSRSGYADIENARIYYETAGEGAPLVMIHAGVADSRQWDHEFAHFARDYRVVRCDMRGYGKSAPVEGEFRNMHDLVALLDELEIRAPLMLMGCSMGGGLAIDFALTYPDRARALILVDSAPGDLDLAIEVPAIFTEAKNAFDSGDLDRTAEIETQIWFDGEGRAPDQVNPVMRKLLFEMDRLALEHEVKGLGKRLPNIEVPASGRLGEIDVPVLIILGEHDIRYMHAAADYMLERLPNARKVLIPDAAHLPNMDQPDAFQSIVGDFLSRLGD